MNSMLVKYSQKISSCANLLKQANMHPCTLNMQHINPWPLFLLFRWHLSHVHPDTDDLAGLHSHGAGNLVSGVGNDLEVCNGGGVKGQGWGVFSAGPPDTSLPVVYGTRMFITVTHVLESSAVGTQRATWEHRVEPLERLSLVWGMFNNTDRCTVHDMYIVPWHDKYLMYSMYSS